MACVGASALWHYIFRPRGRRFANGVRKSGAGGTKGRQGVATESAAQQKALALEGDLDLMKIIQATDYFLPFGSLAFVFQAQFEFALQAKGQEGAKDVAADGSSHLW